MSSSLSCVELCFFIIFMSPAALDLTNTPGETGPNMPERLRRDVTIRSTVQLKDIVCSHKTSASSPPPPQDPSQDECQTDSVDTGV